MMEADCKLETLHRSQKNVDLVQRTSLPVEDVPLPSVSPFRQIRLLLLLPPASQILHLQRQFDPPMHVLQRSCSVQTEPCSQNWLFFNTRCERLLEASPLPRTLHMLSHNVV